MSSLATSTSTSIASAIQAAGIRKAFGDDVVLDGIDLDVPAGTVFALLGPNGSGKTTLVQILSTLIAADAGEAWVGGHDVVHSPDDVRGTIGVTGQFAAVDNLLTGAENLQLMADLLHLDRAEGRRRTADLLDRFELTDAADRLPSTYSGGMVRRLDLAMTLLGEPRIIFLDEPTTGLDPRSRHTTWRIVEDLVRDGVTVFLTTQYLEEADHLADNVALLDGGRFVAQGTPDELKRLVPGGHIRLRFNDPHELGSAQQALAGTDVSTDADGLTLDIAGDGSLRTLRRILTHLDEASVTVEDLTIHTPDLDDVFLALTGRSPAGDPTPDRQEAELS
jgi:ABC-2 type transport system ATP-binding protein